MNLEKLNVVELEPLEQSNLNGGLFLGGWTELIKQLALEVASHADEIAEGFLDGYKRGRHPN